MENTKSVLREFDGADSTKMRAFDVHYPANSRIEDRTMKDLKASKDVKRANKLNYIGAN